MIAAQNDPDQSQSPADERMLTECLTGPPGGCRAGHIRAELIGTGNEKFLIAASSVSHPDLRKMMQEHKEARTREA
jgi:hypothetical protein